MPLEACLDWKTRRPLDDATRSAIPSSVGNCTVHEESHFSVAVLYHNLKYQLCRLRFTQPTFGYSSLEPCSARADRQKLAIDLADILIDKMMSNTTKEWFWRKFHAPSVLNQLPRKTSKKYNYIEDRLWRLLSTLDGHQRESGGQLPSSQRRSAHVAKGLRLVRSKVLPDKTAEAAMAPKSKLANILPGKSCRISATVIGRGPLYSPRWRQIWVGRVETGKFLLRLSLLNSLSDPPTKTNL